MKITIQNKKGQKIKIIKEETDPICLRASIGGRKEDGYYLVYRGDNLDEIEEMLKEVYECFADAKRQLEQADLN